MKARFGSCCTLRQARGDVMKSDDLFARVERAIVDKSGEISNRKLRTHAGRCGHQCLRWLSYGRLSMQIGGDVRRADRSCHRQ